MIQAIAKATDQTLSALRRLAVQFLALQQLAYNAHHETEGETFMQDHEFFHDVNEVYGAIYDSLIERIKGLHGQPVLRTIQTEAGSIVGSYASSTDSVVNYNILLSKERDATEAINMAVKESTMDEGVRNLLCGIADESQVRQYKMQQRLGGVEKTMTTISKAKDAKGHGSNKRDGNMGVSRGDSTPASRDAASFRASALRDKANEENTPEAHTESAKAYLESARLARLGNFHSAADSDERYANYRQNRASGMTHDAASKATDEWDAKRNLSKSFTGRLTQLGAFGANIGKAGRGWYHGNQTDPGSTSVRATSYAAKMKESREAAKSGSALQSKAAEYEAMNQWKKMAPGERGHAMQLLNDSASEDIGKARDCGFEFGHNRKLK